MLSIKELFITGKKPCIKLPWSISPSDVEAGGPGVQGSLVYVSYVAVGGHPGLYETLFLKNKGYGVKLVRIVKELEWI